HAEPPAHVKASCLWGAHGGWRVCEARAARLLLQGRGHGVRDLPLRLPGGWHAPARPGRPLTKEPPASLDRGLALSVCLPAYFGGRILNIPVPHTGHTPFSAGRPFAIFTWLGFEILRLALHFTQ